MEIIRKELSDTYSEDIILNKASTAYFTLKIIYNELGFITIEYGADDNQHKIFDSIYKDYYSRFDYICNSFDLDFLKSNEQKMIKKFKNNLIEEKKKTEEYLISETEYCKDKINNLDDAIELMNFRKHKIIKILK